MKKAQSSLFLEKILTIINNIYIEENIVRGSEKLEIYEKMLIKIKRLSHKQKFHIQDKVAKVNSQSYKNSFILEEIQSYHKQAKIELNIYCSYQRFTQVHTRTELNSYNRKINIKAVTVIHICCIIENKNTKTE